MWGISVASARAPRASRSGRGRRRRISRWDRPTARSSIAPRPRSSRVRGAVRRPIRPTTIESAAGFHHGSAVQGVREVRRVISLLPAATEMVCALEAGDRLVGRSHECDFPESARELPAVTTSSVEVSASGAEIQSQVAAALRENRPLFRLDADRIRDLKPDLILTQGQCAVCAVSAEELESVLACGFEQRPEVLSLSPARFPDLWTDLRRVGAALGLPDEGRFVVTTLKTRLVNTLQSVADVTVRPRVACLEWLDPLMGAGNWIPELVELAGGSPVCGRAGAHSEWLSWEDLESVRPDVIVALPCGFDLGRSLAEVSRLRGRDPWTRLAAVQTGRVFAADGNAYFNRPGPRLVDSVEILAEILHPDRFPKPVHRNRGWMAVE
ncbi:MAG: cobalamin-binding protein [Verrucomicrobiae bacterium]|nr:cobalamin-binding protein [Verrucomicrobiae bacterium]